MLAPPLYLGPPDHPVFRRWPSTSGRGIRTTGRHRSASGTTWPTGPRSRRCCSCRRTRSTPSPSAAGSTCSPRCSDSGASPRPSARTSRCGSSTGWAATGRTWPARGGRTSSSRLGCVSAVERWLAGGPGRLEPFGYAVTFSPDAGRYVGARVPFDEPLHRRPGRPRHPDPRPGVGRGPGGRRPRRDLRRRPGPRPPDAARVHPAPPGPRRTRPRPARLRRRHRDAARRPAGPGLRLHLPVRARVPGPPRPAPRRLPFARAGRRLASRIPRRWPSTWRCEGLGGRDTRCTGYPSPGGCDRPR